MSLSLSLKELLLQDTDNPSNENELKNQQPTFDQSEDDLDDLSNLLNDSDDVLNLLNKISLQPTETPDNEDDSHQEGFLPNFKVANTETSLMDELKALYGLDTEDETAAPSNFEYSEIEDSLDLNLRSDLKSLPSSPSIDEANIHGEVHGLQIDETTLTNVGNLDLANLTNHFIRQLRACTLRRMPYEFSIKTLVKSNVSDKQFNLLYSTVNLMLNKTEIETKYEDVREQLHSLYRELGSNVRTLESNAITTLENALTEALGSLESARKDQLNKIRSKKGAIQSAVDRKRDATVQATLDSKSELFTLAGSVTSRIEEVKARVVDMLGDAYLKESETEEIAIPNNEADLEQLLMRIENFLEDLELSDKSYYKGIAGTFMKICFYPTLKLKGDMKIIVFLLNLLGFLYLVSKFNNVFVMIFIGAILADIVYQVKIREDIKDGVALCLGFIKEYPRIMESLKKKFAEEAGERFDTEFDPLLDTLDDKASALMEKIRNLSSESEEKLRTIGDPEPHITELMKASEETASKLKYDLNRFSEEIDTDYNSAIMQINSGIDDYRKKFEELEIEDPILSQNKGELVLQPSVTVGYLQSPMVDSMKVPCIRSFEEGSYAFILRDEDQRQEALSRVKNITLQLLNKMKPEFLKVNLIDVKNMGADVIDLVSTNGDISALISNQEDLKKHIDNSVTEIVERYKIATREFNSVTDFNRDKVSRQAVTFPYELNIFYNFPVTLLNDQKFQTLMTEGGRAGFTSVVFLNDEDFIKNDGTRDTDLEMGISNFTFLVKKRFVWELGKQKGPTSWDGAILPRDQHLVSTPLSYDKKTGVTKINELEALAKEDSKDSIPYLDLANRVADQIWTKDTLNGIEICVGYRDGDLTKPEYVKLGDDQVHAMMGGATGKGKSNTINVILANLIRNYSPQWLELYMVDFKNVEFNMYTGKYFLPQCSLIAGTTDPEYALSVFSHTLKEMERRKKILANGFVHNGEHQKFKKIEDYNRYVLKYNLEHKIIPRILMLFDEFQVMFQMDDDNIKDQIKKYIARLAKEARAMGIHMFFTSQSMTGTVSDDIKGQFGLRFCLGATKETSMELIGNDAASRLKGKGYIYSSDDPSGDVKSNKLFRIPFIAPDVLQENVLAVRARAEKESLLIHNPTFYDEATVHSPERLIKLLAHPIVKEDRNRILLGEKVIHKPTRNPENFAIGRDDFENILVTGNDKIDTANLINTLILNVASKERTRVILANFDRTLDGFLLEDKVYDGYESFNRASDPYDLFEAIGDMMGIEFKKNFDAPAQSPDDVVKYDPDVHDRHFVFLIGLQKAVGFNGQYPDDMYANMLKTLLQKGPSEGFNFVMSVKPSPLTRYASSFSYRVTSKVDDNLSYDLFGSKTAKNLITRSEENPSFGLFKSTIDDSMCKFKIYEFTYKEELMVTKELAEVDL